jgi:hypothetical protein
MSGDAGSAVVLLQLREPPKLSGKFPENELRRPRSDVL